MVNTRGPWTRVGVCYLLAEPLARRSAHLARKGGQTVASLELPPGSGLNQSLSPASSPAANLSLSWYGSPKKSSPFSNSC